MGLLALLSLLILLLIYILKPNYQQKLISSTFVWKLSLKYKKKQIPISKLRNLLIILCQVCIFTMAAIAISNPAKVTVVDKIENEKVIIIDASATMLMKSDDATRFERAIAEAQKLSSETFDKNGTVSIVLAGPEAQFVVQRATADERAYVEKRVEGLSCTYGSADVDGAIKLSEQLLTFNPYAEIILVTGSDYLSTGNKIVIDDVSVEGEWNAAILDVAAEKENGFYTITVEVACYGDTAKTIDLFGMVTNPNGQQDNVAEEFQTAMPLPAASVHLENNKVHKIVYSSEMRENMGNDTTLVTLTDAERLFSFSQIFFSLGESDGYNYDNEYYLYGGKKPAVKIQYCSTEHENFISGSLLQVTGKFRDRWDIAVTETTPDKAVLSGYDMYIFEHQMPDNLPTDGIVLMVDPDKSAGGGFTVGNKVSIPPSNWTSDYGMSLALGVEHPITNFVFANNMFVSNYTVIPEGSLADGYYVLLYYESNPVFMVKDEPDCKIAVLALSTNTSSMGVAGGFPIMMMNFYDYFLPAVFDKSVYSVFDSVSLKARGDKLTVTDVNKNVQEYTEFPAEYKVTEPGTYTVSQDIISGETITSRFYARIDSKLSNIVGEEYIITSPTVASKPTETYDDLLIYFAAVMVALLFVEWWLQSRSGI